MGFDKIVFQIGARTASLYVPDGAGEDVPLIVLNEFEGDGSDVAAALESGTEPGVPDGRGPETRTGCPRVSLLVVSRLDWNADLSPWPAPAVFRGEDPFAGGADAYREELTEQILPETLRRLPGMPAWTGIAGYSLAGLFALHSLYGTDAFSRAASVSGSLWYPGFDEFIASHEMKRRPERRYLSRGDKEAKVRDPLMRTVRERTEEAVSRYRSQSLFVCWELNPGNHFREPDKRVARAIRALLA